MLFDTLPTSLFKPLTAPGAQVYASILSELFAESQRAAQPLTREVVLDIIISHTARPAADPLASAYDTLHYLESCGWLRAELRSNDPTGRRYTAAYVLSANAFRLLSVLNGSHSPLANEELLAIYDLLQAALREGDVESRLHEAYRLAMQLHGQLKELQHNALNSQPVAVDSNVLQAVVEAATKLEATGHASACIVRETVQSFERLLADISARQRRSAAVIDEPPAAINNKLSALISLLLATDPEAFAQTAEPLITLFTSAASQPQPAEVFELFTPDETLSLPPNADEIEIARRETLRQLKRPISRERVRRLAQALLGGRAEIHAAEIARAGPADLPLLIYLRLYGDGSLGYHIEEGAWTDAQGVGFRDFVLKGERGADDGE